MQNTPPRHLKIGGPIIRIEELLFDATLRRRLGDTLSDHALRMMARNARKVRAYRITYRSNGHEVVGFVVEPRNMRRKLPCLIVNRGGNRSVSMWNPVSIFNRLGTYAAWDYIVVASQYSGCDGGQGKDEFGGKDIDDVIGLKRVLSRHAMADVSRIGMTGNSRGGLMTYLALAKVAWIKAAVVVAGRANMLRAVKMRPEMRNEYKETFGGSVAQMKKRSAVFWAKSFCQTTPLLIMHGTADDRVSPLDSLDLSAALLSSGIHHRLVMFEGDDHFLSKFAVERQAMMKSWFARHLAK